MGRFQRPPASLSPRAFFLHSISDIRLHFPAILTHRDVTDRMQSSHGLHHEKAGSDCTAVAGSGVVSVPGPMLRCGNGSTIMGFICSICGHRSKVASGGSCSRAPGRTHIYMDEASSGYLCRFCGHASGVAAPGSCNPSPFRSHQYIARQSGQYTCRFCGHRSSVAAPGSCNKSPHKHHEYL